MRSETVYRKMSTDQVRSFVSEDGLASITCPNCGMTKQVAVAEFRGKRNSIKVRCRCQQTFTITLEFRQAHRKSTELKGIYEIISDGGGGRATIKDLSRNGIGFMVSGIHNLKMGQNVLIDFALDNQNQTALKKRAVVRSVASNRIGCEFLKEQAFEKDLGFYLRS